MQGRRAILGPCLEIRANVHERTDDGGILVERRRPMQRRRATLSRASRSAPDRRQSVTSAAVAASKYSLEFQFAQSMARQSGAVFQRAMPCGHDRQTKADNRHNLYRESWLHCHRSVRCSYPLNPQQAVSSSRQTIPLSLADHTIPVSVAHKGVCRMVVLHGCDAVTPRLGACNPSIPIVVPQT